jgi:hypothetical protein
MNWLSIRPFRFEIAISYAAVFEVVRLQGSLLSLKKKNKIIRREAITFHAFRASNLNAIIYIKPIN